MLKDWHDGKGKLYDKWIPKGTSLWKLIVEEWVRQETLPISLEHAQDVLRVLNGGDPAESHPLPEKMQAMDINDSDDD